MSNVSYYRFRNTLDDLRDCYEYMDEPESKAEQEARRRLIKLCMKIVHDYEDYAKKDTVKQ